MLGSTHTYTEGESLELKPQDVSVDIRRKMSNIWSWYALSGQGEGAGYFKKQKIDLSKL